MLDLYSRWAKQQEFKRLWDVLFAQALAGDVPTARLLMEYALGPPPQHLTIDDTANNAYVLAVLAAQREEIRALRAELEARAPAILVEGRVVEGDAGPGTDNGSG